MTRGDGGREERLQKVLAAAGVGSRRYCDELIAQGRVTVDGAVAEPGRKVDPEVADVRVDGERVNVNPDLVYLVLNKPQGVVTTADDPQGRPTVLDLVNVQSRVFAVGRLDMDSEGLLLLMNDGDLAHALTHPSFEVSRVYVAQVNGRPSRRQLAQLRDGVELEDGPAAADAVRLLGEGHGKSLIEITMHEGRKREVRRMFDAIGAPVERLARIAYGGVELGDLRQGHWRPLTQKEIALLHEAVERGGSNHPGGYVPRRSEGLGRRRSTS